MNVSKSSIQPCLMSRFIRFRLINYFGVFENKILKNISFQEIIRNVFLR